MKCLSLSKLFCDYSQYKINTLIWLIYKLSRNPHITIAKITLQFAKTNNICCLLANNEVEEEEELVNNLCKSQLIIKEIT